jgi:hypothetical protein
MKLPLIVGSASLALSSLAASPALADPGWEFTTAGNSYNNDNWDFAAISL